MNTCDVPGFLLTYNILSGFSLLPPELCFIIPLFLVRKLSLGEFKPLEKLKYCSGLSLSDFNANTLLFLVHCEEPLILTLCMESTPKLVKVHK